MIMTQLNLPLVMNPPFMSLLDAMKYCHAHDMSYVVATVYCMEQGFNVDARTMKLTFREINDANQ